MADMEANEDETTATEDEMDGSASASDEESAPGTPGCPGRKSGVGHVSVDLGTSGRSRSTGHVSVDEGTSGRSSSAAGHVSVDMKAAGGKTTKKRQKEKPKQKKKGKRSQQTEKKPPQRKNAKKELSLEEFIIKAWEYRWKEKLMEKYQQWGFWRVLTGVLLVVLLAVCVSIVSLKAEIAKLQAAP